MKRLIGLLGGLVCGLVFSAPVHAADTYTFQDLRAMDPTIEEQLESLGFEGDPAESELEVEVEPDGNFGFNLKSYAPQTGKNMWVLGAVLSSTYIKGVQASYLRYSPRKDKIRYHIDASLTGTKDFQNVTVSYDPHIGRWGLFAGVSGQVVRIKTELLPTSPAILIPGGGVEVGFQREWGRQKRLVTSLKYGAMFTYYGYKYYMIREARATIGFTLFRK